MLLGLCAGVGALAAALQSGPLDLPGGRLALGSEDYVLSNYSFQSGTTYFLDFDGNGVRNIVQVQHLPDSNRIELVLHHASKDAIKKHNLLGLPLP